MRFGVLGTGVVGGAVAGRLVELGHEVTMGARTAGGEKAAGWARDAGERAHEGTFADAAAFGEVVINATAGAHSLEALHAAGSANLRGKLLVDIANALDHSRGFPPALTVCNTDSLGEQIQAAFPEVRVVKTLNTVNTSVMVHPEVAPGGVVFMSGNDERAKAETAAMLVKIGWPRKDIVDLGDITTARGPEMYMALWLRLLRALGTPRFNLAIVRGS